MELIHIKENIYYIPNRTNIGVITNEDKAVLIDSGLDDETGRKILKTLKDNSLYPVAIINTHSHADHIGGNSFLQNKTGCKIYAPQIEDGITSQPCLEPLYLFSGANPLEELQNKFLMAKPSQVDYVIKEDQEITIAGIHLGIVPLKGHSPNQIGITVADVIFCGDVILERDVLEKHKIPFNIDINRQREALRQLLESEYNYFVPAHAVPREEIADIIQLYIEVLDELDQTLLGFLQEKQTTEELLKKLLDGNKINITRTPQFYLYNTILLAHLSSLHKKGRIEITLKDNILYWYRLD